MTSAVDVAKYIRSKVDLSSEQQLQDLAYYMQAWALAWTGRPLFDEAIEASESGPVTPALQGNQDEADPDAVDAQTALIVDVVIAHYAESSSDSPREDAPWREARDTADEEISRDAMSRYYSKQSLDGAGPKPPALAYDDADESDLDAAGKANAERWRELLALLAK
ncbi:Panacea domain-containing protein [Luteipulveratus mongoliensis]|uniref:Uncharacterized protein n=1 Tax=Luteipulveratus mongoliensis TaxID=571913 RepID=A0A0K1JF86_9MICO|nr:hypothetical protein [Luteipulveratus mongoliensis]AKU15238.1 hypothetical protein VV02_04140 [Luteipulveratus mongoliensis]